MASYKTYMFLVGYVVFMVYMLGQMEEYKIETDIENIGVGDVSGASPLNLIDYLNIFWNILTFNVTGGTEELPAWFNLLIAVPMYALIILFVIDLIGNTINPVG